MIYVDIYIYGYIIYIYNIYIYIYIYNIYICFLLGAAGAACSYIEETGRAGPTGATFSKAKYKLDAMLMQARQNYWQSNGWGKHFISLCCVDSERFDFIHQQYLHT